MYAARGDIAVQPADGDDAYRLIGSDLVSLIKCGQIESAIDRESSSIGEDMSADVIALDDVTPRYVKAGAALKACDVDLGIAVYSLIDSEAVGRRRRFHVKADVHLGLLQCTATKRIRRSSARFPWALRRTASCPACPSGNGYPFPRR